MLGVSLRLPEPAQVGEALQKYIASNYTAEETQASAAGLSLIQSLRNKMVTGVVRNASDQDHASALAACTSYYRTLSCLIARFPWQSASRPVLSDPARSGILGMFSKAKISQISLLTTWFDAFKHSQRASEYDVAFEKCSVMFNMAALLSRQATQVKSSAGGAGVAGGADPAADSSLKEACKLFQYASGLFHHLATQPEISSGQLANGLSLDLQVESLTMLSSLMLAQAQACFFEQATKTASAKLVAKLASGVSGLFLEAWRRCEKNAKLKAITGQKDVYPWGQHCLYQALCYQAAAHFWQAKGLLAEDEYGQEIAHLERARAILQQARQKEVGLLRNLADNRAKLESAISSRLQSALKDNETIYYASVPKPESVRDPEGVTPVKPLPYLESVPEATIDASKDDPFKHLVSPHLRAQMEAIKGKVGEVRAELERKVTEAEQEAKKQLEELGLPASLDALSSSQNGSSGGLPPDTWERVREIQYKGGVSQLVELNSRIDSAVLDCQTSFTGATTTLQQEAESDATMRRQFAHRWNRRPSEQLTVNLQKDADSIRRFLKDAEASNQKVRKELEVNTPKFDLLKLTQAELEEKLPRATAEQSQQSQQAVQALRHLLATLDSNTASMRQLLSSFDQKVASTDFMSQLLEGSSETHGLPDSNNQALFESLVEPFRAFHKQYEDALVSQEQLIQHIVQSNQSFLSLRSADDSTQRRQAFLQEINSAISSYNKLLANLNEGLKFYADLQAQKIAPFQQKTQDFALARDMEKQLVLQQLTKDITNFKEEEATTQQQSSVFPNALQPPPQASSVVSHSSSSGSSDSYSNPFLDGSSASVSSSASSSHPSFPPSSVASNPNLSAFDPRSQLYQMKSPTPPPGGAQQQQQQPHPQQHPQQTHPFGGPQLQVPGGVATPSHSPAHSPHYQRASPLPMAYPPSQHTQAYAQAPQQSHPPSFSSYSQPPPQQQQQQQTAEWPCRQCTFLNPLSASDCQMCGAKR